MPGEDLEVHMWTDEGQAKFRTYASDRVVLDNGLMTCA